MDINVIIEKANGLPPAPRILPTLNRLLNDPDAAVDEIVGIIRLGPVLSANVIKYANSTEVGRRNPTHSLTDAIMTIGIEEGDSMSSCPLTQLMNRGKMQAT